MQELSAEKQTAVRQSSGTEMPQPNLSNEL